MINSKITKQAVQQSSEEKRFKLLESIDWKLWEMMNMLKDNLPEQPKTKTKTKMNPIIFFVRLFILEAKIANPEFFSMYVGSGHGFILGMFAFFFGFAAFFFFGCEKRIKDIFDNFIRDTAAIILDL